MKKSYKIEVDCANCANLMEEATRKTIGVANATVNFMTQKMIVEFAEGADAKRVMQNVLKARRSSRTAKSNWAKLKRFSAPRFRRNEAQFFRKTLNSCLIEGD